MHCSPRYEHDPLSWVLKGRGWFWRKIVDCWVSFPGRQKYWCFGSVFDDLEMMQYFSSVAFPSFTPSYFSTVGNGLTQSSFISFFPTSLFPSMIESPLHAQKLWADCHKGAFPSFTVPANWKQHAGAFPLDLRACSLNSLTDCYLHCTFIVKLKLKCLLPLLCLRSGSTL